MGRDMTICNLLAVAGARFHPASFRRRNRCYHCGPELRRGPGERDGE
jgi:hypothetical protein